jgi:hypothetical protein
LRAVEFVYELQTSREEYVKDVRSGAGHRISSLQRISSGTAALQGMPQHKTESDTLLLPPTSAAELFVLADCAFLLANRDADDEFMNPSKIELFHAVAEDMALLVQRCAVKYTVMQPRALLLAGDVCCLKGQTNDANKKWSQAQKLAQKMLSHVDLSPIATRLETKRLPTIDDLIDKLDDSVWNPQEYRRVTHTPKSITTHT